MLITLLLVAMAAGILFLLEETTMEQTNKPVQHIQQLQGSKPTAVNVPPPGGDREAIDSNLASAAWLPADPANHPALPQLAADITDARLVTLNRALLLNLSRGESLEIVVPHLRDPVLNATIEQATILPSGAHSLRGQIIGGRNHGLVITLGENSSFATIGTPQGLYNLVGDGNLAWVYPERELKARIDPAQADFVIPERPEAHER